MNKFLPNLRSLWATHPAFSINILIGSLGAIGQSFLLAHTLIDCYPFKILFSPPSQFFDWVGRISGLVSPIIAIALIYLFRSAKDWLIAVIPVATCPIIFWSIYKLALYASGYEYSRSFDTHSDVIGTEVMEYEFGYQAINLLSIGIIVGLTGGAIVSLLSWIMKSRREPDRETA